MTRVQPRGLLASQAAPKARTTIAEDNPENERTPQSIQAAYEKRMAAMPAKKEGLEGLVPFALRTRARRRRVDGSGANPEPCALALALVLTLTLALTLMLAEPLTRLSGPRGFTSSASSPRTPRSRRGTSTR